MHIRSNRERHHDGRHKPEAFTAVLLILLGVTGCGGGGGGSASGAAPPSGGAGTPVAVEPPPPPNLVYTGSTNPVAITPATTGIAAELEFIALLQSRGLTDPLDLGVSFAEGVYDETTVGPDGGEVRLQGQIHADGTGWYANEFSNFRDGHVTINGTEVTHVLRTTTSGTSEEARFEWIHFRVSSPDFSQSLHGSITIHQDPITLRSDRKVDVILTDLPSGASLRLENVRLIRDRTESFDQTYEFTGRVYDSALGYLDVSTETPLIIVPEAPNNPVSGGPWIAVGRDGAAVRLEPLSHLYASLQLMTAGQSAPDRALRVSWDTPFFQQVGLTGDNAPVAVSEPNGYVFEGERQVLDGRMSYHPDGRLHRFRWTLLSTPPGSQAAIEDPEEFRTGFMPDLPGSYLVMLEVDDGTHSARDITSFRLDPNENPSADAMFRLYLPPDRKADVGDRITLDGTMTSALGDRFQAEFDYRWFISRYRGDTELIPIEDGDTARPSFIVDEPGLYIVSAEIDQDGLFSPLDRQFIAVSRMLPPIPVIAPAPTHSTRSDIAVNDVTGDGIVDIVLTHGGNSGAGFIPKVYVYPGGDSGRFGLPSSLVGGTGGDVSVIDIGADARADVAVLTEHGIELFRQSIHGVLQSIGVISENPVCAANMPPFQVVPPYRSLGIGDMNSDGLQDLVVQDACRVSLDVFFQRVDGSFNTPVSSEPNPFGLFSMLTIADMTDDGVDDILIASLWSHSGDNARLLVAPGRGDGDIQPGVVEVVEADPGGHPRVAAGDIDKDGRTDLVLAMLGSLLVYLQGDTGDLILDQQISGKPFVRVVALADIDADGRLDILAGDQDIDVYRQLADGSFAAGEGVLTTLAAPIGLQPDNPDPFETFDVNRDGFDEIVYANNTYVITLFPWQPLICGGSCDGADPEGARAVTSAQKYSLPESGTLLSLSRERLMRASSWIAHY